MQGEERETAFSWKRKRALLNLHRRSQKWGATSQLAPHKKSQLYKFRSEHWERDGGGFALGIVVGGRSGGDLARSGEESSEFGLHHLLF